MRIVLDTNVLISGIFWTGAPAKILDLWKNNKFEIILTAEIFEEYKRILNLMSKKASNIETDDILSTVGSKAMWVVAPSFSEQICEDPNDDIFISAAVGGGAKYIVTGDKALLKLKTFHKIQILKPASFLNIF